MDGLEDGLNLCFQEKNDLEQYTCKSSIRITGLDDHDKDENIEFSTFVLNTTCLDTLYFMATTSPQFKPTDVFI
jgi:hypothetical protein